MAANPDAGRPRFVSAALPEETFSVVAFEASEGLSQLYTVTVDLAADDPDLDLEALLAAPARLEIERGRETTAFHGVLEACVAGDAARDRFFYQVRLRPRLWWLTQGVHNRLFLDQPLPEVLTAVLTGGGLSGGAFALRLMETYPARDFLCQYGESDYDFLIRWMARYGLYYFFEQTAAGEVLVITDTRLAHGDAPGIGPLVHARTSGLDADLARDSLRDFGLRRSLTAGTVTLRDVNYRKPNLDLTASQALPDKGVGEVYRFGEHYRTPDEGRKLAGLRAQALAAACRLFSGSSRIPGLRPGFTFALTRHATDALNGKYLVVAASHTGRTALPGTAGLDPAATAPDGRPVYTNTITAIPAATQYRPGDIPRIALSGSMHAHIDAAASGDQAELDDQGRYTIRLPFDRSGRPGGKASAPVRMLSPYVGTGFGLHCPLHKGTEVSLGYLDGNPDRPVILGAAPNPGHKSPVTSDNQTQCRLTTAGGHKLHIEDAQDAQRILLQSSTGDFLRIGAHNDPVPPSDSFKDVVEGYFSSEGISLYAPENHWLEVTCQNELLIVLGEYMLNILGWFNEMLLEYIQFNINVKFSFSLAKSTEFESFAKIYEAVKWRIHPESHIMEGTNANLSMNTMTCAENTTRSAVSDVHAFGNHEQVGRNARATAIARVDAARDSRATLAQRKTLAGERIDASKRTITTTAATRENAAQLVVMADQDIESCVNRVDTSVRATTQSETRITNGANKVSTALRETSFFGIYSKN